MFLSELTPILKELMQQPIAFTGGFFSGVFRLNISEEPLSSWLQKQGFTHDTSFGTNSEGNGNKPQSISIE